MPELHRYRLFISHAWRYHSDYDRMIQFLNDAPYFLYANYSVPREDPFKGVTNSALKEQLREQIRPVEVVIILGGIYVSHSEWIQFEIDYAKQLGKPILGVRLWGSEYIPSSIRNSAHEIVGWNTASIVGAIRRLG